MGSRTFTEIEIVNRLQMYQYVCDVQNRQKVPDYLRRTKDRVAFTGDRGEPEAYRAEISFQAVEYLACPFRLPFNYHWRIATSDERKKAVLAYGVCDTEIKSTLQQTQVYCLEEDFSVYHHNVPTNFLPVWGEYHPFRPQRVPHTFFIIAHSVEIVVYFPGEDLETYLEQLHGGSSLNEPERS